MAWQLSCRGLRVRVRVIAGIGHTLSEPRWIDPKLVRLRALIPELCLDPFEERYVDNG